MPYEKMKEQTVPGWKNSVRTLIIGAGKRGDRGRGKSGFKRKSHTNSVLVSFSGKDGRAAAYVPGKCSP